MNNQTQVSSKAALSEIKSFSAIMSAAEIEKLVNLLNAGRPKRFSKTMKNRQKMAELGKQMVGSPKRLSFTVFREPSVKGNVNVLGATLITLNTIYQENVLISLINKEWWTVDGYIISVLNMPNGSSRFGYYYSDSKRAHIRPTLLVEDLAGTGLCVGDHLQIGNNTFTVISEELLLCDQVLEQPVNWVKHQSESKGVLRRWYENLA